MSTRPSLGSARLSRLLFDLEVSINANDTKVVELSRGKVVEVLREFARKNGEVDPRITKFVAQSFVRFLEDPKHDLEKAFGLKRQKAGNPGGVSPKRRLSPGNKEEITDTYRNYLEEEQERPSSFKGDLSPRDRAIKRLSEEYKVSPETIERTLTQHREVTVSEYAKKKTSRIPE